MKVNQKLLDLTNKFLEEFLLMAHELDGDGGDGKRKRDDLYQFNYTLADAIAQSNYPKYKEQYTILMGMSSFDDKIAKAMFNTRIQGFVKLIEEKMAYTGEQDRYLLKNIKKEEYFKDDFDIEFFKTKSGENSFKSIPCKTKVEQISFDVMCTSSGFEGSVIVYKELEKEFTDENNFNEVMTVDYIDFYCRNNKIMTINYRYDFKSKTYYEEGTFEHYKHIADINSFYQTISNI